LNDHAVAQYRCHAYFCVCFDEEGKIVLSETFLWIALIGRSIALSLDMVAIHRPLWFPLIATGLSTIVCKILLLLVLFDIFFFGGVDFHRVFRLKRLFLLSLLEYRINLLLEVFLEENLRLLMLPMLLMVLMLPMLPKLLRESLFNRRNGPAMWRCIQPRATRVDSAKILVV
jgi:hypothetical protein